MWRFIGLTYMRGDARIRDGMFSYVSLEQRVPVDPFDLDILQERYTTELRWQLGVPKREDLTLQLWFDVIREDRGMDPAAGEQKGS